MSELKLPQKHDAVIYMRIQTELKEWFQAHADSEGVSMSALIIAVMEQYRLQKLIEEKPKPKHLK